MAMRGRLTGAYSAILLATMIVFAIAIGAVGVNHANTVGAAAFRLADSIADAIRVAQIDTTQVPRELTVLDTAGGTIATDPARLLAHPTKRLVKLLDELPGYFLVLNNQAQLLYASPQMQRLSVYDQDAVDRIAAHMATGIEGARLSVRGDSLHLFLVADTVPTLKDPVPNISRVVVGQPTSFAEQLSPTLTDAIIVIAPIVFLLSIAAAYFILGNVFRPVDQLVNEVEAITDGRSLHRRLPTDPSNDELTRLATTLNAMLTRLEISFAALRRFTADASHELKTPLTVLRADVERAMHPSTERNDRMIALEEALQETARMSDLVNSLLMLARGDEGRFDIYAETIDLEPLVREVYETAVILGEDAGLTVSLVALENATVAGDRPRLRQLFLNLITNAIKYTPRGGRVEIAVTRSSETEVSISVRDTGIGISAPDLPHVFERFWRADRVRSRASERGGFGLGLSIAQWIVQAHGGNITAQSRLGRGSVFTISLPISSASGPSAELGEQSEVEAPAPVEPFTNS